ncbi:MAG TPA: hypothetical protein VK604_10425 [Bryobacteraceae bacterium]|nr:hypothetical protein [Bryobacteraceae bacterium]
MKFLLPDFGDLVFSIAVVFGLLIVVFETLERRREGRQEQLVLQAIDQEFRDFTKFGRF